jgi:hypothetical protein
MGDENEHERLTGYAPSEESEPACLTMGFSVTLQASQFRCAAEHHPVSKGVTIMPSPAMLTIHTNDRSTGTPNA